MTRIFENKMIDELRVGESASIIRTLHTANLRAWAAVTGNPSFDESFMDGQGVTQWAAALFSTHRVQAARPRLRDPIRLGEV